MLFRKLARVKSVMFRSIFEFAYVHCFQWSKKINGTAYFNRFSASMMVTLLILINFGSLAFIVSSLTGLTWSKSNKFNLILGLAVLVLTASVHRYFSRGDRHSKLMKYYESSQRMQDWNGVTVGLLVLGSLLLLICSWFLGLMTANSGL